MHPVEVLLVPLGKAFRNRHADEAAGVSFLPGRRGGGHYAGSRPLPRHGPHLYPFHLYALDARVDLAEIGDVERLPAALNGHVLASGMPTGTRES
jgi:phosphatidylethanolamine-binding protein (PEBP) family uncharacterized protein